MGLLHHVTRKWYGPIPQPAPGTTEVQYIDMISQALVKCTIIQWYCRLAITEQMT